MLTALVNARFGAPSMRSFLLTVGLLVVACGAPQPGGSCDSVGFLCIDATTAIECQVGKWSALPCRGPMGCVRQGNLIKCDMSGNLEGDACAASAVGSGFCTTDGKSVLECRNTPSTQANTLKRTQTCSACTTGTDSSGKSVVNCTP